MQPRGGWTGWTRRWRCCAPSSASWARAARCRRRAARSTPCAGCSAPATCSTIARWTRSPRRWCACWKRPGAPWRERDEPRGHRSAGRRPAALGRGTPRACRRRPRGAGAGPAAGRQGLRLRAGDGGAAGGAEPRPRAAGGQAERGAAGGSGHLHQHDGRLPGPGAAGGRLMAAGSAARQAAVAVAAPGALPPSPAPPRDRASRLALEYRAGRVTVLEALPLALETDDLAQQGWVILADLVRRWRPDEGSFAAYARVSFGWELARYVRAQSHARRSTAARVVSVAHDDAAALLAQRSDVDGRAWVGEVALRELLGQMPVLERQALLLCLVEGYSE